MHNQPKLPCNLAGIGGRVIWGEKGTGFHLQVCYLKCVCHPHIIIMFYCGGTVVFLGILFYLLYKDGIFKDRSCLTLSMPNSNYTLCSQCQFISGSYHAFDLCWLSYNSRDARYKKLLKQITEKYPNFKSVVTFVLIVRFF